MEIIEIRLKVYMLKNLKAENSIEAVASLVDKCFLQNDVYKTFHYTKNIKNYVFNNLFPIEKECYKEGSVYSFAIRTIDENLANHFCKHLVKERTEFMQSLSAEKISVKWRKIQKLYSLTPCVAKFDGGYWRKMISVDDFKTRIIQNAIKKYNVAFGDNLQFCDFIKKIDFINRQPVATKYKNIKILGDKVDIEIKDDEISQKIGAAIYACGLLEMNGRGFGFCNAKFG